ncbi:MAG: DUF1013 domain-containing protein [Rhizobiales bacterium]|nr:DUF1013 domain-containing protein [Hyphomicrobiales bacterium]
MSSMLLMPRATAVWLVDNTSLTFSQIGDFCDIHELEVKGIADGDVAQGILGLDPIGKGQLTRAEIEKGQDNSEYRLKLSAPKVEIPEIARRKTPRYTPLSRRQDRPNAILWLLRYHPELRDSEIIRLVGTTKPTIQAIRERTHWNSANLVAADPVGLGLSTQINLDAVVRKAGERADREKLAQDKAAGITGESITLTPAERAIADAAPAPLVGPTASNVESVPDASEVFASLDKAENADAQTEAEDAEEELDADSVFAKLKTLKDNLEDSKDEAGKE